VHDGAVLRLLNERLATPSWLAPVVSLSPVGALNNSAQNFGGLLVGCIDPGGVDAQCRSATPAVAAAGHQVVPYATVGVALPPYPVPGHAQLSPSANWAAQVGAQYTVNANLLYRTASNQQLKMDVYYRRGVTTPQPTIVYMHGGFWVAGAKETAIPALVPWMEMGWNVVNVEYRLAPQFMWPAGPEDLAALTRDACRRFNQSFEPLRPELYRYCRHLTRSPWDAEDLAQDTFLQLYQALRAGKKMSTQRLGRYAYCAEQ